MADADNTLATADGWTKDRFGKIWEARPANRNKFLNKFPFENSMKLGQQLSEVVWLTDEQGFTFDAGTGTAFTLNDSVAAISDELTGSGAEIVLRTTVALKALSAAIEKGPAAFGSTYKQLFANMTRSFHKKLEIQSLWGADASGLGVVSAQTDDSGTSQTFSITEASWASGIWSGSENMYVDCYDTTLVTKRNASGTMKITAVTPPSGGNLGTVTFLGTEAEMDNIVATDVFKFKGSLSNEATGLMPSLNNSGTYLGISGSTYSQWAGNTVAVGSADLTWDKVEEGVALAVGKGLDSNACLYVSTRTWGNLNSDMNALRSIDSSYSVEKTEAGTKSIVYHSQNGMITVEPHVCMRWGEAGLFPEEDGVIQRVGSTDLTFEIPGMDEKYWRVLTGANGVELRAYSDQLVVNHAPAQCVRFTGITNS